MLSGKLWPAHPHPLPGECLSSWIVRTAHHNGLKVQSFGHFSFNKRYELWNRDIDRLAPESLLEQMSVKTGVTLKEAKKTTLSLFEGRLFESTSLSGQLRWITPLKLYHRIYAGFGMQYCPLCLAESTDAYYRIAWRVAFYTFCPKHLILMEDRCRHCGVAVAFHRIELGKYHQLDAPDLAVCWKCGLSLTDIIPTPVNIWHENVHRRWRWKLAVLDRGFVNSGQIKIQKLNLLHQLCRIIASHSLAPDLQQYLCDKTNIPYQLISDVKIAFEQRSLSERHYILELAWWLIEKYPRKINEAIKYKKLRSHYLYKDMPSLRFK